MADVLKPIQQTAAKLLREKWTPLTATTLAERRDWSAPGVYALAYSGGLRTTRPVDDLRNVFYVGMSCSIGGVRGRLRQFVRGIDTNGLHSAAMRFYRDVAGGKPFSKYKGRKKFYVVAVTLPCDVRPKSRRPKDLRQMGHVTCLEYYVRSVIRHRVGKDPTLNKR